MSSKTSLYTIAYSAELLEVADGYLALDNSRNERPDWREYWPMRNFLLGQTLEEGHYYGFFSPRFGEKTGLNHQRVVDFVESSPAETDAVIFSPQVDVGAFFPNVFVGEDQADAGFLGTCQGFVDAVGLGLDLPTLLMDSSHIVFSNYIVARPSFWRAWLDLGERLYEMAESGPDELRAGLTFRTNYREGVQRKVFLMERLASLVFITNPHLRVRAYNPFTLGWSMQLNRFRDEAVICDALKMASAKSGFPQYRALYDILRQRVILSALGQGHAEKLRSNPLKGALNTELLDLLPRGLACVRQIAPEDDGLARAYLAANPGGEWQALDESVLAQPEEAASHVEWSALVLDGVMEHLADPAAGLKAARAAMVEGGVLVLSFQNAQHWRYQAQLALGEFVPTGRGVPLRRFSRHEIFIMLDRCGFRVDAGVSRIFQPPEAERYLANIRSMVLLSGGDPRTAEEDAKILQYVIRAVAK